jgi:hypothetical protein
MMITRWDAAPIGSSATKAFLEIKAPLPHWLSGEINERFRPQLQGQLYVSQRSWVDIVCWHDILPKLVKRVEPDEKFIKALDRELQMLDFFIERVMEKMAGRYEVKMPQGSLALKAAFPASLETVLWIFSVPGFGTNRAAKPDAPAIPDSNARPPYPPHPVAGQTQA